MIQQFHFFVLLKRTKSRVSKRYLYTTAHSSIIHHNWAAEATQVSNYQYKWMNKQNAMYT